MVCEWHFKLTWKGVHHAEKSPRHCDCCYCHRCSSLSCASRVPLLKRIFFNQKPSEAPDNVGVFLFKKSIEISIDFLFYFCVLPVQIFTWLPVCDNSGFSFLYSSTTNPIFPSLINFFNTSFAVSSCLS